ncbi:gp14 [Listeria phage P35]|uniref:gp14 n=1 Tax=Listeria phage P35 TaxID=330398 RepID=UPI00015C021C|nr:gp14 [Listeria phage P35]AAY53199.1 gp14 [Listeria phage P35]
MEVFKLFGRIGLKTDDVDKGFDDVEKKGQGTSNFLTGTFGKMAGALGGVFAATKIFDFGKQAVEAAADLDAVQSQFTQVFGNLTDQSHGIAKDLGDQFGMIPSQLEPGMIKFQGLFKGSGIEAEKALKMTKTATTQAADAAAFANVGYEEAQGSIQSFILGNYEAGDAIGVQANDNTVAQYAIQQGAVKTTAEWQKMGDAQKMQMRLGFIGHVQKLSGIQGQASRESGSWAVVMDKLKASWQQFLAIIGKPILNAVLPIVKGLSDGMSALTKGMQSGGQATGQFGNAMKVIRDVINNYIKPAFNWIKMTTAPLFREMGRIIKSVMGDIWKTIREVWTMIKQFWDKNGKDIMKLVKFVFTTIVNIIRGLMKGVKDIISGAWQIVSSIFKGALKAIMGIVKVWSSLFKGDWKGVWKGIQMIFSGVWTAITGVLSGALKVIWGLLKSVFGGLGAWFKGIWDGVKEGVKSAFIAVGLSIARPILKAQEKVKDIIDKIKGFFNFTVNMPHIPLPYFGISPAGWDVGDLLKGKIPKLDIDWHADGGVMNQATAFGMLNGRLQVGGEAGREAIIPLRPDVLAGIGHGIAQQMNMGGIVQGLKDVVSAVYATKHTYLDAHEVSMVVEDRIMRGVTT